MILSQPSSSLLFPVNRAFTQLLLAGLIGVGGVGSIPGKGNTDVNRGSRLLSRVGKLEKRGYSNGGC